MSGKRRYLLSIGKGLPTRASASLICVLGIGLASSAMGSHRKTQDFPPSKPTSVGPIHARFPDGKGVSISSIHEPMNSENIWWKLDGKVIDQPTPTQDHTNVGGTTLQSGRFIEVSLDVSGMPVSEFGSNISTQMVKAKLNNVEPMATSFYPDGGWVTTVLNKKTQAMEPKFSQKFGTIHCQFTFAMPKDLSESNLVVELGKGRYRPIAQWANGKGDLQLQLKSTPYSSSHEVGNQTVNVQSTQTSVTLDLPESVGDRQWRVVAFDIFGKPLDLHMVTSMPDYRDRKKKIAFGGFLGHSSQLGKVVLEVRDREIAVVKHLSLVPKTGK